MIIGYEYEKSFQDAQRNQAEMAEDLPDREKLIRCLQGVREGIEHVGLLDYINRTLEEVKK